jgi:hypothetical protein
MRFLDGVFSCQRANERKHAKSGIMKKGFPIFTVIRTSFRALASWQDASFQYFKKWPMNFSNRKSIRNAKLIYTHVAIYRVCYIAVFDINKCKKIKLSLFLINQALWPDDIVNKN